MEDVVDVISSCMPETTTTMRAYAGAHLPLLGLEPVGGEPLMSVMRGQCDARPTVTFPAARHHRPLADTKLYCLVTETCVCVNNLPDIGLAYRKKTQMENRPFFMSPRIRFNALRLYPETMMMTIV